MTGRMIIARGKQKSFRSLKKGDERERELGRWKTENGGIGGRVDRKMEGWKRERGREKQRGEGERTTTADRKQGVVTENEAED